MKKIILLVLLVFLVGCNKTTEAPTTLAPTTIAPTTETTTDLVTSIISDEIYLYLVPGVDTIGIFEDWIDMGAYFVINDVEYEMTTLDLVNNHQISINQITYTYEYENQIYEIIRYVAVIDQTSPVIALNPGIDTITVGSTWLDAGVNVSDNYSEEVEINITGYVDINTPGVYEITYEAIDSSLNTSTITRYVNVIE